MSKLDLRKELKAYYSARQKPEIIDVPPAKFLTILDRSWSKPENLETILRHPIAYA